jgi:hypothetical protein
MPRTADFHDHIAHAHLPQAVRLMHHATALHAASEDALGKVRSVKCKERYRSMHRMALNAMSEVIGGGELFPEATRPY